MTYFQNTSAAPPVAVHRLAVHLGTVRNCLLEARPAVLVIFGLRFLTGATLSDLPSRYAAVSVALGCFGWICATCYVYLINGANDSTEDRVNGSTRPIATGRLGLGQARTVAHASGLLAILCCASLSRLMVAFVALFLALGYLYSVPPFALKRHTGRAALVVLLGGGVTYATGCLSGGGAIDGRLLCFAIALCGWMGLVGIQAKDLSDVVGDRAAGRHTLAVVHSERFARLMVAAAAVGTSGGFLVIAAYWVPTLLGPAVIMGLGGMAVACSALTRHSVGDRSRTRRPYQIFMITQYAVHLAVVAGLLLS